MEPNTIGGGRYEMSGLLGRGGMAEVRKARDLRLGRPVAIKRLRVDLASDPTFQTRFSREAQSAASLNHPAIVAVYDTGEEPTADGSGLLLPYIVMEYVEGRTLRDILREGRRILPQRALEITGSVLDALDYSHRAGIVHRDIKPANVMLTPAGDVKVMDFGIARAIADASSSLTQTAAVVGTAQYLSPEQARGEQVDARSDLYSTGCLLYELLTGRPPFVGDSPISVAYQHVREEPRPPSAIDPEITPTIDAITLKALSKSVDERYQSAAQMRADIDRALEGREVLAPVAAVASTALQTEHHLAPVPVESRPQTTALTAVGSHREDSPPRRRTGLWLALAVLLALVIASLVVIPRLVGGADVEQVEVPSLVNLTVPAAREELEDVGLELGETSPASSPSVEKGLVLRQSVDSGELVDEGSEVDVTVSAGADTEVVPPVSGLTLEQATAELEALEFVVNPVEEEGSAERRGEVTRTDPPEGSSQPIGSEVTVYYAAGLERVPDVVGETEAEAVAILDAAGFDPVSSDIASDEELGVVTKQTPRADARRVAGSSVVIYVSLGPAETPTPTVTVTPTLTEPTETEPTETEPTETETTETEPTATKTKSAKPPKPPKPQATQALPPKDAPPSSRPIRNR
ncbi:MAG: Stk1 family PASTA domain-containing Ser/Thr kinase [Nocardioidaceae bacterium]|nr:Stk1 family PASTA domain-containing Ser/Thr kinase [Nocardioidaceae bacterium]